MNSRQSNGYHLRQLFDAPPACLPCSGNSPWAVARNGSFARKENKGMCKRRELIFSSFSSLLYELVYNLATVMCMSH